MHTNRRAMALRGAVAAIATAALFAVVSAAPAYAADDTADSIAQFIATVAPDQGSVLSGSLSATGVEIQSGSTTVQVPTAAPSSGVIVSQADSEFSVSLPKELSLAKGEVALDGTVVYSSVDDGADAAVQVLEDGITRIQTIIGQDAMIHEFSYEFSSGYAPSLGDDGSVLVGGPDGVAVVAPAWARDANGANVPTWYQVRGDQLVQVVDTTSVTAFPVVADPAWNWYAFAYGAKFNRAETRQMASAGSATGMCSILGLWAPPVAIVCGAYGAYFFTQAGLANGQGKCVFISVVPAPLAMVYDDGDCY